MSILTYINRSIRIDDGICGYLDRRHAAQLYLCILTENEKQTAVAVNSMDGCRRCEGRAHVLTFSNTADYVTRNTALLRVRVYVILNVVQNYYNYYFYYYNCEIREVDRLLK